jgi:hypothetical protein
VAERKNLGIAVANAKRLSECYLYLSEAFAARPSVKGDEPHWISGRSGSVDTAEKRDWVHRGKSQNVAEACIRSALRDGLLPAWVYRDEGEAEVDRFDLRELTHRTLVAGVYLPTNGRESALAGRPLWVKNADWRRYVSKIMLARYGETEQGPFHPGHSFKRDDPASIAPWWSVNQTLAWVATRIPSYVENIGNMEEHEPREYRPYFVQAISEAEVAESDEGNAFLKSRCDGWPDGSYLAHGGRALLEKIEGGSVTPATIENGRGRAMAWHEFVGIGTRETGEDWLALDPQPLFSSAEVMRAFPATDLDPAGSGGGIVPANRQLDHAAIIKQAGAMRHRQSNLSKGSAAASIVAELPPNPRTGKRRDTRHIERLIAHLWEGGAPESPT